MTLLNKILIGLLVAVIAAFGIFIFVKEKQINDMQTQISASLEAQKTLIDGITRSSATFATKGDLNTLAQQQNLNLDAIQKDLDSLGAAISGINVVIANSSGQTASNIPSSSTIPNPNPLQPPTVDCNGTQVPCPGPIDINKYTQNIQTLDLHEQFANLQVPFGSVSFDASNKAPWSLKISPRSYNIVNTVGTNPNTGQMFVYNKLTINANNKDYEIPITTAKFEQQVLSPTFSWWNPRLFLTTGGAVNVSHMPLTGSANVGATLQIMSYGKTKTMPMLSIAQVGVGYETATQSGAVIVNPVNFSMSGILPPGLIDSTYLGPSLQAGFKGDVMVGANLSVGF